MESVYSHHSRRQTKPPVVPFIVLGLWISHFAAALLPISVSEAAYWLLAIGLGILCGLRIAWPGSFFVGIGVALTVLSVTQFLPWWLRESGWWNYIAAPLICVVLALLYMALARPAFMAAADPVRIAPFWIRNALVLLLVVQLLDLTLRWAYVEQPCSWIDLTRTLRGCRRLIAFPEQSNDAVLSADGTRAASVKPVGEHPDWNDDIDTFLRELREQPATISLWDVGTGKLVQTVEHPSLVRTVALSRDGRRMATIGGDTQVRVWSVDDGALVFTLNHGDDFVQSLAFSPDAALLVSAGLDATGSNRSPIRLWSLRDGTLLRTIPVQDDVDELIFSPDGSLLATNNYSTISLWRVSDGTLLRTIETDLSMISFGPRLAFSPDGQLLASAGTALPYDERFVATVQLWRIADGTLQQTLRADPQPDPEKLREAYTIAFSADGAKIVAIIEEPYNRSDRALIWRVTDGTLLQRIDNLIAFDNLRFTADGSRVMLADRCGIYTQAIPDAAR